MPVPPRKIQPQITRHAAVGRCDATDPLQQQQQQAVDLPGFRIRQQVSENDRAARSATAAERERVRRRLVPRTHHRGDRRETPRLNDMIKTRQGAGRVDRAIKRKGAGSWKRRRKTWNRPSTTCSPTLGERAWPGHFDIEIDYVAAL